MPASSRRQFLRGAATLAAAVRAGGPRAVSAAPAPPAACTLSIGTYSLKGMPLEEAIRLVAGIGYDGLEIAAMPGLDSEPGRLPPSRRRDIVRRLEANGLRLTALMENLPPDPDDARRRPQLDRLRGVFELAGELTVGRTPLVQTVLGGGSWDEKKALFRDRLGDWLESARASRVILAIKPHRGGALSRPEEAIWLIRQLGDSLWLRMVYDYSHYAFRDMPLEETVRTALPYTAHVALNDAVRRDGTVVFELPGQSGTIDYERLLRLFHDGGYTGDFCCEVSAMVSGKPGYDPTAAAKTCHANIARAFAAANVPRAGHRSAAPPASR